MFKGNRETKDDGNYKFLSMEHILTTLLNSKIHVIFIGISAFTIADNSVFVMFLFSFLM